MQNGVAFAKDATECARRTQGQCAACFPRILGAWSSGHLGEDTGLWPVFWGMPDGLHRFFSYWGIPCRTRMLMAALVRSCCRSRAATVLAAFLIAFLFAAAMRAAVASTWKMSDASVSFLSRAASTAPTSAHAAISSPVNCSAFSRCSVVYGPMVPVIAALLGPTSPPLHGGDGSCNLKTRSIPGRLSSKALRSRSIWAAGRDGSRRGEALGARGDVGVIVATTGPRRERQSLHAARGAHPADNLANLSPNLRERQFTHTQGISSFRNLGPGFHPKLRGERGDPNNPA